jgi:hypothetical protein
MAETGRLTAPATPAMNSVTLVRVAIVAGILVTWEAVAASACCSATSFPRSW